MKRAAAYLLLIGFALLAGCTQSAPPAITSSASPQTTLPAPSAALANQPSPSAALTTPSIAATMPALSDEPVKVAIEFFNLGKAENNPKSLAYLSSKSQIRGELSQGTYMRFFILPGTGKDANYSSDTPILELAKLRLLSIMKDRAFIAIVPKNESSAPEMAEFIQNTQNAVGLVIMEKENGKWLIDDISSFFGLSDEFGILPDVAALQQNEMKPENCPRILAKINSTEDLQNKCLKSIAMLANEPGYCDRISEGSKKGAFLLPPLSKSSCIFDVAKFNRNSGLCSQVPTIAYGTLGTLRNDCYAYFAEMDNLPALCDKITLEDSTGKAFPSRRDRCLLPLAIIGNDTRICEMMGVKSGPDSLPYLSCYTDLARKAKRPDYCYKFPDYYNISANIKSCLYNVANSTG